MLSQKAIEEASAMLHASLANHQPRLSADGQVKRRTYAECQEEERRLHEDPYGCGGSFGRWLIAEQKAKELAARKSVEPLVNPKGNRNGPRVPLETILDRLKGGAWASPQELAKAYGRACGWVVKLRGVAIAQKLITKEEWDAAFRRGCESHSDDGKRVLSSPVSSVIGMTRASRQQLSGSEVRATRPQRSTRANKAAPHGASKKGVSHHGSKSKKLRRWCHRDQHQR